MREREIDRERERERERERGERERREGGGGVNAWLTLFYNLTHQSFASLQFPFNDILLKSDWYHNNYYSDNIKFINPKHCFIFSNGHWSLSQSKKKKKKKKIPFSMKSEQSSPSNQSKDSYYFFSKALL